MAASLTVVSDLISSSVPSAAATHTIQFTATHAVLPSGRIVITPASGAVSIPGAFDYRDVDLAVATSGPYIERTLASTESVVADGVAVTPGSAGSFVITLNSTIGLAPGDRVRIKLGTHAVFGAIGTHAIVNSASVGSYRITMATTDQASAPIDNASAMIVIVTPVSGSAGVQLVPPVRSGGLPTGLIEAGNVRVELSLNTDGPAHCRYATTSGIAYASMLGEFLPSFGQSLYATADGHQNDTTYNYYVRCLSLQGLVNTDDYVISFALKPTPISNTSIPNPNTSNGLGGVGPYPDGSAYLYLASVTFDGTAIPFGAVTILKDGVFSTSVTAKADGSFHAIITGLERGTYTFQLYAVDAQRRKSPTFSSTITVGSGSSNTISDILIASTTSAVNDAVGKNPPGDTAARTDINGDKKVNLVDFSIMLSFWGTSRASADINSDGTVNLADFSILLFNWTG